MIEKILNKTVKPKLLIYNKVDKITQSSVVKKILDNEFVNKFDEIYYVSALKNKNIETLLDGIVKYLPIGSFEKSLSFETNVSKQLFFSELTREAIFKYLNQEIPYQILVKTVSYEKVLRNYKISQIIYVKNENHKKIILGKNGSVIKKIGTSSRKQIEKVLKHKVSLFLEVQITK